VHDVVDSSGSFKAVLDHIFATFRHADGLINKFRVFQCLGRCFKSSSGPTLINGKSDIVDDSVVFCLLHLLRFLQKLCFILIELFAI